MEGHFPQGRVTGSPGVVNHASEIKAPAAGQRYRRSRTGILQDLAFAITFDPFALDIISKFSHMAGICEIRM
jgi:hypothetical protein